MPPTEQLDCQQCGACCRGADGWVHLDADDDARVAASPVLAPLVVTTMLGSYARRSLRMVRGACAALRATPSGVTCAGYDARPEVCRALAAGSDACRAARTAHGLA